LAKAQDIMTKNILTVKEDTSVRDAINLIITKKISALPVVDDNMSIIGLISEKDLLPLAFYDSIDDISIKEFIRKDVVFMEEDTDLFEICEFFMNNNFKRVPIVSGKKLTGIISRKDMLRFILSNQKTG
jgi:transcriptional regulator